MDMTRAPDRSLMDRPVMVCLQIALGLFLIILAVVGGNSILPAWYYGVAGGANLALGLETLQRHRS